MKLVPRTFFALPLLSALAGPLYAQAPQRGNPNYGETFRIEFEGRAWDADLISELRISSPFVPGSDLTTESLGLPSERIWDYRGAIRISRRFKARASWFLAKYEGDSQADAGRAIAGLVVPAGTPLSTRLELEDLRVGAEFDIVTGAYGFVAVVGEYARFQSRTVFESGDSERSPEYDIQLPVFGVKARVYMTPAFALTVEGVGMKWDSQGVMSDFDATATYNLIPNLAISYGYRNSYNRVYPVEDVGDRALFRLRGQYFGVSVRF